MVVIPKRVPLFARRERNRVGPCVDVCVGVVVIIVIIIAVVVGVVMSLFVADDVVVVTIQGR